MRLAFVDVLLALLTGAPKLNRGMSNLKRFGLSLFHHRRQLMGQIHFPDLPAILTEQKGRIMAMGKVIAGNKGIARINAVDQPHPLQKLKGTINGRRLGLRMFFLQQFQQLIRGHCLLFRLQQRQHRTPRWRQSFALLTTPGGNVFQFSHRFMLPKRLQSQYAIHSNASRV